MRGVASQGRVKHANVEPTSYRVGVVDREVLSRRRLFEAAAMKGDSQLRQLEGSRLAGRKLVDVVRKNELLRHLILGIVIAEQEVDRDAGQFEAPHLADEEDARVEVAPTAVVEVTGDDHEVHRLRYGLTDKVLEGVASGCPQQLRRCVLVG